MQNRRRAAGIPKKSDIHIPTGGGSDRNEGLLHGTARIRHEATGLIHEIESDELEWDAVGSDERQMGPEIHYEAVVEHPELGQLTWSLWEYPLGVENDHKTDIGGHQLIDDFEYGLEHEPEPDIWVDYWLPDNPFTIFMDSYHRTGDVLADHGRTTGPICSID